MLSQLKWARVATAVLVVLALVSGGLDVFVANYRTAVPEPATGLLLMLGMVVLLIGWRPAVSKPNR